MSHARYRDLNPPEKETPDEAGGRYVVAAIGIDRYRYWPKLQNAVSDAKGVFDLCGRMEFVQVLPILKNEQATGPAIAYLIERLHKELKPEDRLLLFFAGHGHTRVEETDEGAMTIGGLCWMVRLAGRWSTLTAYKAAKRCCGEGQNLYFSVVAVCPNVTHIRITKKKMGRCSFHASLWRGRCESFPSLATATAATTAHSTAANTRS